MHVLTINHEFPPIGGGAGNACWFVARELVQQGVQITVLTSAYEAMPRCEIRDGVHIIRVPAWRKHQLESSTVELLSFVSSALWHSRSIVKKEKPDLLHTYFGIPSGAIARIIQRQTGLPYLISFRGRDVHGGKGLDSDGIGGLLRWISKPVWRKANALVANSDGLKKIALKITPDVAIDVIPNGIDTLHFKPGTPSANGPVRRLFVGRLEPYKGLNDLIVALSMLKMQTAVPFSATIVGDGALRNSLPQDVQKHHLQDRVTFAGPKAREAMPGIYQQADIFVLPSIIEGMSNAILEAMATGLPTVATAIPGSEDLVQPGKTGFLVPPAKPEALAQALQTLLEQPALRQTMGQNARREAENQSWVSVAHAYNTLYQRLIKPK